MILKDAARSFKRTRLFTTINIIGLSIGLAVSIMLTLFILNELSFDKHFKDADRIITLHTVLVNKGEETRFPRTVRQALTEIPSNIPGIEATTQIYNDGRKKVIYNNNTFETRVLYTEPNFFDVFGMKILQGTVDRLKEPNTIVISDTYARTLFGSITGVIGKKIDINNNIFTICGVVKKLPQNTHFNFDILINIETLPWLTLDYFTFYKIKEEVSMNETAKNIEDEYTRIIRQLSPGKQYGKTEKLTDIYLNSKGYFTLGTKSDMSFVWLLGIIAFLIQILAIANFVNLYSVQGESRTLEIGIRKTNGAERRDLISLFLGEISIMVLISFVIGFILTYIFLPQFSQLIDRSLDLTMLKQPKIIAFLTFLLIITILLSASYPSFYLSKFNPIDILSKRLKFSKRRLTSTIVIFQSAITIILLSFLFTIHSQTHYLKGLSINYDPRGVMMIHLDGNAYNEINSVVQELEKLPDIEEVAISDHYFGRGGSGQSIKLLNDEEDISITEYRVEPGICEMMKLQLIEGHFFKKDDPEKSKQLVLNESAIKMLGLNYPAVGTTVVYKGNLQMEIIGVVKDFIYGSLEDKVEPIAISSNRPGAGSLFIKPNDNISRQRIKNIVENTIQEIDQEYVMEPVWGEDIYNQKLNVYALQTKIITYAAILAMLISALGLFAVHSYSINRRTKETAIRRINGANGKSLFITLSADIFKWILAAGIIAVPIVYYIASNWLNNYANKTSLNIWIFILPIVLQLMIVLITTSGITIKVLSQNPVDSLKSE